MNIAYMKAEQEFDYRSEKLIEFLEFELWSILLQQ
jgi:hypothetical protein